MTRWPRGVCPICGRTVYVTADGYIAGNPHKDPATAKACAGNGRKALGKEEQ